MAIFLALQIIFALLLVIGDAEHACLNRRNYHFGEMLVCESLRRQTFDKSSGAALQGPLQISNALLLRLHTDLGCRLKTKPFSHRRGYCDLQLALHSREEPEISVEPLRICRMAIRDEHILLLGRNDSDRVLPVPVQYTDGESLEKIGQKDDEISSLLVGMTCIMRGSFFQAISRETLGPMKLMQIANGCSSFVEAALGFLKRNGRIPRFVLLRPRQLKVIYRDMGAQTDPAPAWVSTDRFSATLVCGGGLDGDEGTFRFAGNQLKLELSGPGEAMLFSKVAGIPFFVTDSIWREEARLPENLPEFRPGAVSFEKK